MRGDKKQIILVIKIMSELNLRNKLSNIYKPKGVSSFDVVRRIKRLTGEKKVGHAGTLDPLAEGVLIVGVGRESTKKLRFILEEDKEYIGEVKLGMYSTTDDEEGEKSEVEFEKIPNIKDIEKVTETFIGDIIQISPAYSAIKIGGERAYKKARRGEKFTRPPRIVTIKEIEILEYDFPVLKIRTVVGSGTYIRSLAREIGEKLGTGGYLTSLVRTRIGDYNIEDAIKL